MHVFYVQVDVGSRGRSWRPLRNTDYGLFWKMTSRIFLRFLASDSYLVGACLTYEAQDC